jgi:hypothetical protein
MRNINGLTPARHGDRMIATLLRVAARVVAVCVVCLGANAASGPPQILVQPTNTVAREGEWVHFSLQIDGTTPLTVHWQREGEPVDGLTGLSLVAGPLTLSQDGDIFSATVINELGEVSSSNAVLSVTPGIVIAASANRSADLTLFRGWPMVLEVALHHPDAFDPAAVPLLITGTNGPWFRALELHVRDGQDASLTWPFHPAPFTNETVELTADFGARMLWWLTQDETATLPQGTFTITATLNTTNATRLDAWRGVIEGGPVHLAITNEPAILTAAQEEQKHRLLADYALLFGDRLRARAEIDALLKAYPTNIGGLIYDGSLKEEAGLLDDALHSLELGLEQVALQTPDADEPPMELLFKRDQLNEILSPPVLEHELLNQQIVLGWSGHPSIRYRLETSMDLHEWSLFATNFNVLGQRFSVTVDPVGDRRYFRLAR